MTAPVTAAGRASIDDPVISVDDVTLRFGGVTSLADVSLAAPRGEVMAVIGPNGAGKTSLFNCLTGVYLPQEGTISLRREDGSTARLNGRKPHAVTRLGVGRTFQNIRLFNALTAVENVKVGADARGKAGPISVMLGLPRMRHEERATTERALELLSFVGLGGRHDAIASSLSYGEQRRLEIARALATGPQVLLLDEPAAGTNPAEKNDLARLITRTNQELGVSVLLIEHDMKLVMSVASYVVVLNFGRVIAAGPPEQIQRDPAVIEAYLGTTQNEGGAAPNAAQD
ncbi:MAG TPA: ABC transporter ATP-binding protein [Mycobacteriales bacterium]|nr:ABC transporter ATP-binding protein [Mycobacteriales bacterium]